VLLQVSLHGSDISNCAKPWAIYEQWTAAIMEEFFAQGEKERAGKLDINPGGYHTFYRNKPPKDYTMQLGFIGFVIAPLFETIGKVPGVELQPVITHIRTNVSRWEKRKADEEDAAKEPTPQRAASSPATA
jgi:hypothetical protein